MRMLSELGDEEATEDRPPAFVRPPDVLGDFRLGREIGRGGIGSVYEATQISLGRRVAVKVLPPASLLDRRQLRRFEIEAQAAAAASTPEYRSGFRLWQERGVPFFAMRLIEGRNLAEVVGRFRAAIAAACRRAKSPSWPDKRPRRSTMPIATMFCIAISSPRTFWSMASATLDRRFRAGPHSRRQRSDRQRRRAGHVART